MAIAEIETKTIVTPTPEQKKSKLGAFLGETARRILRTAAILEQAFDRFTDPERGAELYRKTGMMTAFPGQGSGRDNLNHQTDKQQPR